MGASSNSKIQNLDIIPISSCLTERLLIGRKEANQTNKQNQSQNLQYAFEILRTSSLKLHTL